MGTDAHMPIMTPPMTRLAAEISGAGSSAEDVSTVNEERTEWDMLQSTLGWTHQQIGTFTGVHRTTVSGWVNGKRPCPERVKALLRLTLLWASVPASSAVGETVLDLCLSISPPGDLPSSIRTGADVGVCLQVLGPVGFVDLALRETTRHEITEHETQGYLHTLEETPHLGVIRARRQTTWTQAEWAAFFGVTHSTPAVWEAPDPGFGAVTAAEVLAVRCLAEAPEPFGYPAEAIPRLWTQGIGALLHDVAGPPASSTT